MSDKRASVAGAFVLVGFPALGFGQSCGELGGDYCSQSTACPADHLSLGQSFTTEQHWVDDWCQSCNWVCDTCWDCQTYCDEDGNCWDECSPYDCDCRDECTWEVCGGHWESQQVLECNPCCRYQPPDPGPSCGAAGGDYCSQAGSCPAGYDSLGQTYDCNPCCRSAPPPPPPPPTAQLSSDLRTQARQGAGTVNLTAICGGSACISPPDEVIRIYLELTVDGVLAARGSAQAQGCVSHTISAGFTVDRSDRYLECRVVESWSGGESVSSGTVPRRAPEQILTSLDRFTYFGFGNYERYDVYDVIDNYRVAYGYSGTPVDEAFVVQSNGCNLRFITGQATLNNEGRFSDTYTTFGSPIPACAVDPSCTTSTVQIVDIEGFYSFSHAVTWKCDDVVVGPW